MNLNGGASRYQHILSLLVIVLLHGVDLVISQIRYGGMRPLLFLDLKEFLHGK